MNTFKDLPRIAIQGMVSLPRATHARVVLVYRVPMS